jgi:hypothetical protein
MKLIDMTTEKWGRLTPTEYVGAQHWRCTCDCGKVDIFKGAHLRSGNTKSCGCLYYDVMAGSSNAGKPITLDGVNYPSHTEARRAYGIHVSSVRRRMDEYGWSLEKSITTPLGEYGWTLEKSIKTPLGERR